MLTKSDLKQIDGLFSERFSETRNELTNDIRKFKDEIIILLDKVMEELKAIREEQTVISGYKDQIEDHETRIGKIENLIETPKI